VLVLCFFFFFFFFFFFLFLCFFVISSCIRETKQTSNNATAEAVTAEAEVKSTLSETQEADKQKWLPVLKDIAAFVAAGGIPRPSKQKTPELEAWFGRLEPVQKEFFTFLQDENNSWWKSDKEFAMLLVSLIPEVFDDLSDELKNDKDFLLSIATAKAAKETAKAAREAAAEAAREAAREAAKEKAAKERAEYVEQNGAKIAAKLGVRVDQIVCHI